MATTFTFRNLTKINRGGIDATIASQISPILKPTASSVPDYFNPVAAAAEDSKTSADGFNILIPVYGREQYITLTPAANNTAEMGSGANDIVITVTDAVTIAWYDEVMAAFGGNDVSTNQVRVKKATA